MSNDHETIIERVEDMLLGHKHEEHAMTAEQPTAPDTAPPVDPAVDVTPPAPDVPVDTAPPEAPAPVPASDIPIEHPDHPDNPVNQVQEGPTTVPDSVQSQIPDAGPTVSGSEGFTWEGGETVVDTGWLPDGANLDAAWTAALTDAHGTNADGSVATPSAHLPIADAALIAGKAIIDALARGGEYEVTLNVNEAGDNVHVEIGVTRQAAATA